MVTSLVIIFFDLILAVVLVLFIRALCLYLRTFKGRTDPYTVATMILLGIGILSKITVSLPLRFLALHQNGSPQDNPLEDYDDFDFLDSNHIVLAEKISLLLTASCIDVATMCNLTRWALIIVTLRQNAGKVGK